MSSNPATTSGTLHRLSEEAAKALFPGYSRITEGHATVFFAPPKTATVAQQQQQQQQQQPIAKNDDDANQQQTSNSAADATKGDISVFYNPPQVVNRDLSVCVLQCISNERPTEAPRKGGTKDGLVVLEALSASGLRSVRFWHEVSGLRTIVANDLDADAVECIRRNVEANGIRVVSNSELVQAEALLRLVRAKKFATEEETEAKRKEAVTMSTGVVANRDDAIVLMQRAGWDPQLYPPGQFLRQKQQQRNSDSSNAPAGGALLEPILSSILFDVVDLDPYGTVGPFLDSAMDSCKEGALISATSTDSAILCGNFPETCLAKYGGTGIKTDACHEMAPRIVLAALERAANRRGKYIEPLLSLHIDFYVRVFVRVYTQPAEVKLAMCKMGLQVQCARCPQYHVQPMGHVPARRLGASNNNKNDNNSHKSGKNKNDNKGSANPAVVVALADQQQDQEQQEQAAAALPPPQVYPTIPDRSQGQANFHVDAFTDHAPEGSSTCVCCGGRLLVGGPIYCGPMHNTAFCDKLLAEIERRGATELKGFSRIRGLVVTARDELPDVPLFTKLATVASEVKMCCPPASDITRALNRLGYRVSSAHCDHTGFKTDAPMKVLFGVVLQHKAVFGHDGKKQEAEEEANQAADQQQQQPLVPDKYKPYVGPLARADFSEYSKQEWELVKARLQTREKKVPRFVPNAPNWGPRARHTGAASASAAAAAEQVVDDAGARRDREQ